MYNSTRGPCVFVANEGCHASAKFLKQNYKETKRSVFCIWPKWCQTSKSYTRLAPLPLPVRAKIAKSSFYTILNIFPDFFQVQ